VSAVQDKDVNVYDDKHCQYNLERELEALKAKPRTPPHKEIEAPMLE